VGAVTGKPWTFNKEGKTGGPKPPEEAPEESSALPSFPETAWRGLFADYRKSQDGSTEACDAAHFATFWAAVATIQGRKVEMYSGDTVYPNVYLNVFGETGDKKTTAERRISRCDLLEHYPQVRFISGVGSTEGLAEELSQSETGVGLFFWEEFATFLSHARWTGSTLLQFFTECFDCPPEWSKPYRKNPIRIVAPTPSILTATTPEWFWKHARAEDFFGGFGNRFLYFNGPRKAPLPEPGPIDGQIIAGIKAKLKIIGSKNPCKATWATEARKEWDAFYTQFEKAERSSLLRVSIKRAHVYVRKLAATYAFLEETLPHIDSDQLQAARDVVMYSVACTERLLDLQAATSKPQGELEQRFLTWVTNHPGDRVRRLQQRMWKYCGDSETFNRVLQSLVRADRIEIRDRRLFLST
jgi:hypothetical protein